MTNISLTNPKNSLSKLLPVLFGFFIMGFVDVVGISTNYVQKDFNLSNSVANLLPMAVFLWFFIFSIPTALLMNKIGRKKTVLLSLIITTFALLIPLIGHNFTIMLIAFSMLGIGNTIIQVSLNPLLTNVVSSDRLTSSITMGQFIKAIASFLGPIIAAYAATSFNNWRLIFPIYAAVTVLSMLWLIITPIEEGSKISKTSSFTECLVLLNNKTILLLFLGILSIVGIDVGLNTTAPKLMTERTRMPLEDAGFSTSLYFLFRTAGAFIGAIILVKFSAKKFYIISSLAAILAFVGLFFVNGKVPLYIFIGLAGFACANMFSIIFSFALKKLPEKSNEISGLMVMGVAGGAIFPWLMGVASDSFKAQIGAIIILLACCFYQLFLSLKVSDK